MRITIFAFYFISLFCNAALIPSPAVADSVQGVRTDTPSGFPVPRFVSLKGVKTNCRSGPSKRHPIRFTYYKKGAPVLVIAETVDHWRKVRDRDGDECWAHKSVLRAAGHAFSIEEITLLTRPRTNAKIRGRIAEDVLVKIEKEKDGWVRISATSVRGWAKRETLWGLPSSAARAAAHN